MSLLNRAVELAIRAHDGQHDRYGAPYVLHPLRVMHRVGNERERIIAVLHDTVEDTSLTLNDLRESGFSGKVIAGVDALTRRTGETYHDYIIRLMSNPEAVRVKLADLEDNMDLRRYPAIEDEDVARLRRYHRYWRFLAGMDDALESEE